MIMLSLLSSWVLARGDGGLAGEPCPSRSLLEPAQAPAEGEPAPLSWGGLVRSFYTTSAREATAGAEDASGHVFEDVDLHFAYRERDVRWRVSAELEGGNVALEDAWASWRHFDWLELVAGQFKPRVVRSASIPPEELLFRERTFLGAAFDAWDDGFGLGGHHDQFDYWLAVTDGANGSEADHFWSLRAEWALYDAAFADVEGARGAPDHLRVLWGVNLFRDVALSADDGGGYGTDLALTFGPYAFHGEWARLDEAFARTIDVFNGHLITLGDGDPFAATLSRRVGERGEAALRFEGADDADDTESLGISAGWRPGGGAVRWVADLALVEGDTRDFSLFSLGLVLGTSGLARPFQGE